MSGSAATLPASVTIGGTPRGALLARLRAGGVRLNPFAEALFADPRFTTLEVPRTLPIVARTVAGLGFPDGATYAQVVERAREQGLAECPLETAAHLRLACPGEPAARDGSPGPHDAHGAVPRAGARSGHPDADRPDPAPAREPGATPPTHASGAAPPDALTVASPPLDDRDDTPRGFYLRHLDGEPWLRGYRASSDHVWHPADVFVFARARQVAS